MRAKKLALLLSSSTLLMTPLISCGDSSSQEATPKIAWDSVNAPERIGINRQDYKTHFYELERQARLSKKPWSDNYWPSYRGGISYRWNHPDLSDNARVFYNLKDPSQLSNQEIARLSPSEKMDLLLGDNNYSITKSERRRTGVMARLNGQEIPRWFGLCHAWATATLSFESPNPVTLKNRNGINIPFGSSDIKALLVYFVHKTPSRDYFVSRRCNVDDKQLRRRAENGEITLEEYRRRMEAADCIGVNPGAFHIILANMIGRRDQGFIADVTRDAEVWNQAVHGYNTRIVDTRTQNFSQNADPRTTKELRIATQMHYTIEIGPSWYSTINQPSQLTANYEYWLELDKNGDIVGGTWISDLRPDFLWRSTKPEFTPDFKDLETLYKTSIQQTNDVPGGENKPNNNDRPADTGHRNPSEDNSRRENRGTNSDILKITAFSREKVFSGNNVRIDGVVKPQVERVEIIFYNDLGKKIASKTATILNNKTFTVSSFFFLFQKFHSASVLAYDKQGHLLDDKLVL